jgi:hypothetical protein
LIIPGNFACKLIFFSCLAIGRTFRNALSALSFVFSAISSLLVASNFSAWNGGGAWGFFVLATFVSTIRSWESEAETDVINYESNEPNENTPLNE